jgi:hypothetical protein
MLVEFLSINMKSEYYPTDVGVDGRNKMTLRKGS